jgi:phosphatidylserine decarboxylase precursor-related protein
MINFLMNNLLWTSGWPVLVGLVLFLVIGLIFSRVMVIGSVLMLLFSIYFFRNPDRACPHYDQDVIICPADGTIVDITDDQEHTEGYGRKLAIFLSVFDVHVQWAPVAGTIKELVYTPGSFLKAYLPKSSKENEHNDIIIETLRGTILVRQIAGMIARRICCWVAPGQSLLACEKIGMIRFGSRVELLVPSNVKFQVSVGDQVYGGQTVLGRFL